ncbi:MAG: hypothetical protein ACXABV_09795 [Candidatus Thorarchaeota archaeon]
MKNFEFESDTSIDAPTMLYVPKVQYPNGFILHAEGCDLEYNRRSQLVLICAKRDGLVQVMISRNAYWSFLRKVTSG